MKKILFFTIIFLSNISAQNIPNNATHIILFSNESPQIAFRNIGKILLNDGYSIQDIEDTFMIIETQKITKRVGLFNAQRIDVKILAEVIENPTRIKLTCYFTDPMVYEAMGVNYNFENEKSIAKYYGSGSSKEAFEILNSLAHQYDSMKIDYLFE